MCVRVVVIVDFTNLYEFLVVFVNLFAFLCGLAQLLGFQLHNSRRLRPHTLQWACLKSELQVKQKEK